MKFSDILARVNGFSTPVFGISWQPPTADIAVARRIIAEVETRRVLFSTFSNEVPDRCVASVLELRKLFTEILAAGGIGKELEGPVRIMRRYCVRFLDRVGASETRDAPGDRHLFRERQWMMHDYWFGEALGELRSGVTLPIAIIASSYGLDVDDELAQVLPQPDRPDALGG